MLSLYWIRSHVKSAYKTAYMKGFLFLFYFCLSNGCSLDVVYQRDCLGPLFVSTIFKNDFLSAITISADSSDVVHH